MLLTRLDFISSYQQVNLRAGSPRRRLKQRQYAVRGPHTLRFISCVALSKYLASLGPLGLPFTHEDEIR